VTLEEKVQAALACKFEFDEISPEPITIRDYLRELLRLLWVEQDGFSGKRPFGNSGWHYDLMPALIEAGLVDGSLDEDGYVDKVDDEEVDRIILGCIAAM